MPHSSTPDWEDNNWLRFDDDSTEPNWEIECDCDDMEEGDSFDDPPSR